MELENKIRKPDLFSMGIVVLLLIAGILSKNEVVSAILIGTGIISYFLWALNINVRKRR